MSIAQLQGLQCLAPSNPADGAASGWARRTPESAISAFGEEQNNDTSVRELAREYIERAPEQVRTPYRTAIERELGWKPRSDGSMIAGSLEIDPNAWGFDAIRGVDAVRGDMLEHAGPPEELVSALIGHCRFEWAPGVQKEDVIVSDFPGSREARAKTKLSSQNGKRTRA
jgi:hypothetical protein